MFIIIGNALFKMALSIVAIWAFSAQSFVPRAGDNVACILWAVSDDLTASFSLCVVSLWVASISLVSTIFEIAIRIFIDRDRLSFAGRAVTTWAHFIIALLLLSISCLVSIGTGYSCSFAIQKVRSASRLSPLPTPSCFDAFAIEWGRNLGAIGAGTAACWLACILWFLSAILWYGEKEPKVNNPITEWKSRRVLSQVNHAGIE